ncbi:protein of unknown function [Sterolibacterium denitrificans]|uniref:Uncharacterized protein n=1 Tax=Sterolibacterium denitrificans TaxID=157592 RepID=A0A7Z7HRR5_9PROT|nr:protein of unknown function [Sterolibacterium denitrificans]
MTFTGTPLKVIVYRYCVNQAPQFHASPASAGNTAPGLN